MTPEIIARDEFIVVGMRTVVEMGAQAGGSLWKDKFLPRRNEVPVSSAEYYGVFNFLPTEEGAGRYEYVAGVQGSLENIPVGMVGWVIPEGNYAVAQAIGPAGVNQVCRDIITDWLPDSGYLLLHSPMFAFTRDQHPDSDTAVWMVNIPIETPETLAQLEKWLV